MNIQVNLCKSFFVIIIYVHTHAVSSDVTDFNGKMTNLHQTRTRLSLNESSNSISATLILAFKNALEYFCSTTLPCAQHCP